MGMIRLFKNDLVREIRDWESKAIIDGDQARAICREYGMDYDAPRKRGYLVLMVLGYLFLGLTAITLVAANWEEIPRALRMAALMGLTLAVQGYGLVKFRRGEPSAGVALLFLGSLFYGASIMLIAQIYHIGEHYPDGIFYWALGVMPLGLLTGSSLLLSLSTLLGFIWLSVETGLNYFPTFFPLFLLSLAAFLVWCKPNRSLFMALVMGLGLFLEYCLAWVLGQGRGFEFGMDCLALAWCFFVVCHGIALWMGRRPEQDFKDYGLLLGLWSLRFFFVVLLALGFEGIWDAIFDAQWQYPGLFFALALAAGGFHVWAARSPSLIGGHLFFLVLFYGALFPGEWASPLFFQVLSNLVMVILGAGLIVQGIREHRSHYFFLGICAVLVTGLFRYMDLIGDYLGSAALFAGCALILLISARYWKQHQGGDHG